MPSSALGTRPSPLACSECRRRHLKCDGHSPRCARCSALGRTCTYAASRRGIGGGPRPKRGQAVNTSPSIPHPHRSTLSPSSPRDPALSLYRLQPTPNAQDYHAPRSPWSVLDDGQAQCELSTGERGYLLNLYYEKFHPAHPMLVPRRFYETARYPPYVDLVVCALASHYAPSSPTIMNLREAATDAMRVPDERSAHRVRALVLYAVLLHASHQPQEAEATIGRAAQIAMAIGLNRPEFAAENAANEPVEEESLRRTWWELYVVEACFAALYRKSAFASGTTTTSPYLPCDEAVYAQGKSSTTLVLLQNFQQRSFAQEGIHFAPCCYRIEAVHILARVIALAAANDADADDVQAVDNALASWQYYLPAPQTDFVDASGHIDQMLFQANLFIHCANVFLHFPRSDLPLTVPNVADITCAQGCIKIMPTCPRHTAKAVAASKELSDLAAVPWPVERHSPFFICGLTLGCIVQLAISSVHLHACGFNCLQQHRDRVTLMLGALKHLGQRWAVAQHAHHHLRAVAANIFAVTNIADIQQSATVPTHDSMVVPETVPSAGVEFLSNVSWFDLFSGNELRGGLAPFDEGLG